MARICYGLYASAKDAQPAVDELTRRCEAHPAFLVHVHEGNLNPQDLPDCGTDLGRNNLVSGVGGGVMGLVGGGLGGAFLDIMGLGPLTGAGLGMISGILIGVLSGLMSGARSAKKPLRDLSAELETGKVIVTVAVEDHAFLDLVLGELSSAGGRRVGDA